ncbi:MAG: hypothetical protein LBN10_03435 [Propionibacteriaceae bacterium]|nr:hypothetical protein [Propionibacteriaceae bacterium]
MNDYEASKITEEVIRDCAASVSVNTLRNLEGTVSAGEWPGALGMAVSAAAVESRGCYRMPAELSEKVKLVIGYLGEAGVSEFVKSEFAKVI